MFFFPKIWNERFRKGVRCHEKNCGIVVHEKCSALLPNTCGIDVTIMAEYMRKPGKAQPPVSRYTYKPGPRTHPERPRTHPEGDGKIPDWLRTDGIRYELVLGQGAFGKVLLASFNGIETFG